MLPSQQITACLTAGALPAAGAAASQHTPMALACVGVGSERLEGIDGVAALLTPGSSSCCQQAYLKAGACVLCDGVMRNWDGDGKAAGRHLVVTD